MLMGQDVGRGIIAPRNSSNIVTGATEMRTLGATAAAAINATEVKLSGELAQKIGTAEAYRNLVPRDEAEQYGIPGPRGLQGPRGEGDPGPPGPGGSIALEETDPGCFVDSEITWLQWDTSVGTVARAWNPNTETYHMIHGDTGRRNIRDTILDRETIAPGGRAWIQRVDNTVRISLYDLSFSDSGTVRILESIPQGFRPIDREGYSLSVSRTATVEAVVLQSSLYIYGAPSTGGRVSATIAWATENPWPTSLPGIPV